MLPYDAPSAAPAPRRQIRDAHAGFALQAFDVMDWMITLVFSQPSDRIPYSPNRAAAPVRSRSVGGAVKRDVLVTVSQSRSELFRVLFVSFRILLLVCLLCGQMFVRLYAQTPADENKSKDDTKKEEAKREEPKKDEDLKKDEAKKEEAAADDSKFDDVRKNTRGKPFKPGDRLHIDVDMALVNVTVTDPYNRLVTGLDPDN